jgi:hypothetical protein
MKNYAIWPILLIPAIITIGASLFLMLTSPYVGFVFLAGMCAALVSAACAIAALGLSAQG